MGLLSHSVAAVVGTLSFTLVGSVTLAWLAFKYFGDKWITAKFSERLEAFKHSQQQELERLRLMINTTFDRTVKLHSQEYEVLPDLWQKLAEAFAYVMGLVSPLQTYPDLDKLADPAFEYFLAESGLPDYQKDDLRKSRQRTKDYQSLRFWQSYGTVSAKVREFRTYFMSKGIFVPKDIKEKIERLDDLIHAALIEKEEEERSPSRGPGRWDSCTALRKEGKVLRDEIEAAIQARLWDTATPLSNR